MIDRDTLERLIDNSELIISTLREYGYINARCAEQFQEDASNTLNIVVDYDSAAQTKYDYDTLDDLLKETLKCDIAIYNTDSQGFKDSYLSLPEAKMASINNIEKNVEDVNLSDKGEQRTIGLFLAEIIPFAKNEDSPDILTEGNCSHPLT